MQCKALYRNTVAAPLHEITVDEAQNGFYDTIYKADHKVQKTIKPLL